MSPESSSDESELALGQLAAGPELGSASIRRSGRKRRAEEAARTEDSGSGDHYSPDHGSETEQPPARKAARRVHSPLEPSNRQPAQPAARRPQPSKAFVIESANCKSGGIFKTAAIQVLRGELRLMCTGEITRVALRQGYVNVQGKTPEATMASALYTDIKRKEGQSVFIRPHEGLFGLREWLDMGYRFTDPKEPVEPYEVKSGPASHAAARRSGGGARPTRAAARSGGGKRQPQAPRAGSEPPPLASAALLAAAGQPDPRRRQFSCNLDVLCAAVDEVSGLSCADGQQLIEAAIQAEEAEAVERAACERQATASSAADLPLKAEPHEPELEGSSAAGEEVAQPPLSAAVAKAEPGVREGSGEAQAPVPEAASTAASWGEPAPAPVPVPAGGLPAFADAVTQTLMASIPAGDFLSKVMTATHAELTLKGLEDQLGRCHASLGQPYMALCKLYSSAGMLEKACSSLSRAMEISDAAKQAAAAQ